MKLVEPVESRQLECHHGSNDHLRVHPETTTSNGSKFDACVAQKLPADHEFQCLRSSLRIAHATYHHQIEEGLKHIDVDDKDDSKRASKVLVGISVAGDTLPAQTIMKGATAAFIPSYSAPFMDEARDQGFILN
jgi:hypothetical protein